MDLIIISLLNPDEGLHIIFNSLINSSIVPPGVSFSTSGQHSKQEATIPQRKAARVETEKQKCEGGSPGWFRSSLMAIL